MKCLDVVVDILVEGSLSLEFATIFETDSFTSLNYDKSVADCMVSRMVTCEFIVAWTTAKVMNDF